MTVAPLVEHFFRHQYGQLVAVLCRRVGVQHLAAVEDAAQSALLAALEQWKLHGPPHNPSAWLYAVAHKQLSGQLRAASRRQRLLRVGTTASDEPAHAPEATLPPLHGQWQDELLAMLFVCCDEALPPKSQLALALKTLCGFGVREIAQRLLDPEPAVYKRLARARKLLAERSAPLNALSIAQCLPRLPAVRQVLYALFAEGYFSSHPETTLRRELCDEALRLGRLLVEHPVGQDPETYALLALMHLHAARFDAREQAPGVLLLLDEQNRAHWDPELIGQGMAYLARSAEGEVFGQFHAEAGIAAEHCLAPSVRETCWERIVHCYQLLVRADCSPIVSLNYAVALAEWQGPEAGLAVVRQLKPNATVQDSFVWCAVLADLYRRTGHDGQFARFRDLALARAPSPSVRRALARRLSVQQLGSGPLAT